MKKLISITFLALVLTSVQSPLISMEKAKDLAKKTALFTYKKAIIPSIGAYLLLQGTLAAAQTINCGHGVITGKMLWGPSLSRLKCLGEGLTFLAVAPFCLVLGSTAMKSLLPFMPTPFVGTNFTALSDSSN